MGVLFKHNPGAVQAILEDPDDVANYRMYQDWLLENGEDELSHDLARLIGVQLELEGFPETVPVSTAMDSENIYIIEEIWRQGRPIVFRIPGWEPERAKTIAAVQAHRVMEISVSTSRVSGHMFRGAVATWWDENFFTAKLAPGFDLERYERLLSEQHRLILAGSEQLYDRLAYVPCRDEEGRPCAPDKWGVFVMLPAMERYSYCIVPPRLKQYFRRGFIHKVEGPLDSLVRYGPHVLQYHPVQEMVVTNKFPMRLVPYSGLEPPFEAWFEESEDNNIAGIDRHSQICGDIYCEMGQWSFENREDALKCLNRTVLRHCQNAVEVLK